MLSGRPVGCVMMGPAHSCELSPTVFRVRANELTHQKKTEIVL